jgi:hypothetical protein
MRENEDTQHSDIETERKRVMMESLGAVCYHMEGPATDMHTCLGALNQAIGESGARDRDIVRQALAAGERLCQMLHKFHSVDEYRSTSVRDAEIDIAAERKRVMLESLGAACHHLSQPMTIISACVGKLKRGIGESDASVKDLVDRAVHTNSRLCEMLHWLNCVNEYRTEPCPSDSATRIVIVER